MAWNDVLVERLRYYIDDIDVTNYLWTDDQLTKFLVIAANQVLFETNEWGLDIGYVIDTYAATITPDPVEQNQEDFCNLMVLKAACIIARSQFRKASASGGFKILDDKSTIDTTNVLDTQKGITKEFCEAYTGALEEFARGNRWQGGAVFGPHTES